MTEKKRSIALYVTVILGFCFIIICVAITAITFNPSGTLFDIRRKFSNFETESTSSIVVLDDYKAWVNSSGKIISDNVQLQADDCLLVNESSIYYIYQTNNEYVCKKENCESHVYIYVSDLTNTADFMRYEIGCFSERYRSAPRVSKGDKVTTSLFSSGYIYVTDFVRVVKFDTEKLLVEDSYESVDEVSSLMFTYSAEISAQQIFATDVGDTFSNIIDAEYISSRSDIGREVVSYCNMDGAPVFYDYRFVIDRKLYFYMLPTDVLGNYYPTLFEYDYSSGDVNYIHMCSPVEFLVPDKKCVISYMP